MPSNITEFSHKVNISLGAIALIVVCTFVGTSAYNTLSTLEQRMDKRYKREMSKIEKLESRILELEKDCTCQ
jgi:hypothetical protein